VIINHQLNYVIDNRLSSFRSREGGRIAQGWRFSTYMS